MAGCEQAGQRPGGGARLGIDVLDVVVGRPARDKEPLRDLLVGETAGQEPEDLNLTAGQAGWPASMSRASWYPS